MYMSYNENKNNKKKINNEYSRNMSFYWRFEGMMNIIF